MSQNFDLPIYHPPNTSRLITWSSPCQHICANKFWKLFFITNSNVYMMSKFRQKYFPTHYIYCYLSRLLLLSPLSSGNVGDVVAGAKECWPTRFGSVPRLFTPSSTAVQAQLLTIDDHHGHHCYQWLSLTSTWIIATSNHHWKKKSEMLWRLDQCDSGYWI